MTPFEATLQTINFLFVLPALCLGLRAHKNSPEESAGAVAALLPIFVVTASHGVYLFWRWAL